MLNRSRVLTFVVALVLSVGGALFAASPAYAGCQSTPLSLYLSNGSAYTYYCSGHQYPYSGYVSYNHGGTVYNSGSATINGSGSAGSS